MLQFRFLTGDINWLAYGGTWISKKLNNGEFDYYLAIRFTNWLEDTGETLPDGERYHVELLSVSPSEAGEESLARAFACCGMDGEDENSQRIRKMPLAQVDALLSYGIYAHLKEFQGNNSRKLLRAARAEAQTANMLYGFYMDRIQNRIGDTGWEFQQGKLGSHLAELATPEATTIRKMEQA